MQLTHSGESAARVQTRVRILLLLDRSQGNRCTLKRVAEGAICSEGTVRNVKRIHLTSGMEAALYEKPRPGVAPTFTGETEAKSTMLACSEPPEGYGRWNLRLLADKMVEIEYVEAISHVTVGKMLKKRTSALASKKLVYRRTVGPLRGQDERRLGCLPTSV